MFSAVLDDVILFRDCIAAISELIDEGLFKIKQDGIRLLAADRAVVAVVDFKFGSENFKEYNYQQDANMGLNLQSLLQVLRRAKSSDVLAMKLEESRLILALKGAGTRKFTLPLLELHEEVPPGIEKLSFPAKVEIMSEVLADGIKDASLVADSVVFEISADRFIMRAEGSASSVELELPKDSDAVKLITTKEARARYSIEYLEKMIKARRISDVATLAFDTNYPMKLTFSSGERVTMSFILAPRVEE